MKRRQLITAIGGLAAGTSLTLGSGAFTSVSADRQLTVEIAGDNNALLGLKQLGDGTDTMYGKSVEGGSPEEVAFSFPGTGELADNPDLGLGSDSTYEFDRDSGESDDQNPTEGLLRITNQGTQSVEVYSEDATPSDIDVELYDVTDPDKTALRDESAKLDIGEYVDVGFRIRTHGADVNTFEETLTIIAEAPDE